MKPLVYTLFGENELAKNIQSQIDSTLGDCLIRHFPDQETYIRINDDVKDKDVIIVESLNQVNEKILPILFFAETAKALGAKRVGLVAPYLAYMRQDKQFQTGEGITSNYFARLLSQYVDWLVTVDPHLHRHHKLNEIYSIPNTVAHASDVIADWINNNVKESVLIGPDQESEQWVASVAKRADKPYVILEKVRYGDKSVKLSLPAMSQYRNHVPILIDDIISTATTMIEAVTILKKNNLAAPVCLGIHGIFAGNAYQMLMQSGAAQVVTCNTIPHLSNKIDLSTTISNEIEKII